MEEFNHSTTVAAAAEGGSTKTRLLTCSFRDRNNRLFRSIFGEKKEGGEKTDWEDIGCLLLPMLKSPLSFNFSNDLARHLRKQTEPPSGPGKEKKTFYLCGARWA